MNKMEETDCVPKPAFSMDGYYVWCGSVIRAEDGRYHMFASRWKREHTFHPGWMTHSEVVRAVADTPMGPFQFQEVVLPARGPEYWDGCSTHNPSIIRWAGRYVLFYTGMTYPLDDSPQDRENLTTVARASKRVGFAVADRITGPWTRFDAPVLPTKPGSFYSFLTSNPSPAAMPDGSLFLLFKSRRYIGSKHSSMFLGAARSESFDQPFRVITEDPLFGDDAANGEVEDPFLWIDDDGTFRLLAKDMRGAFGGSEGDGVELSSPDGLHWSYRRKAYSKSTGGTQWALRERPFLLWDPSGDCYLYTAVADRLPYLDPSAHTWNAVARWQPGNITSADSVVSVALRS